MELVNVQPPKVGWRKWFAWQRVFLAFPVALVFALYIGVSMSSSVTIPTTQLAKATKKDAENVMKLELGEAGAAFRQIPMKLWQVPLFNCLSSKYKTHNDVSWSALTDQEAFKGRWRCYCLEERPTDFHSCFSRFTNATIYRSFQSPKTRERTIVLLDNVGTVIDNFRVDSSFEPWTFHYVSIYSTRPCRAGEDPSHRMWAGNLSIPTCGSFHLNFSTTAPYNEPFTFSNSPILLSPMSMIQDNHYHSIAGTTGALQYTITVNTINKFYYDQLRRKKSGESISEAIPPLIRGSQRSYNNVYSFDPSYPRIEMAFRASCGLMNFSSVDDANYGWLTNDSANTLPKVLAGYRLPPSYLSREILFGDQMRQYRKPQIPNVLGTLGWFGRREGYCNLALPHESYATVADLWVNMIGKHLATQWSLRRKHDNAYSSADVVTGEEYLTFCPLQEEETIAARWAMGKISGLLGSFAPAIGPPSYDVNASEGRQTIQGSFSPRQCMKITRPPTGQGSSATTLCVLTVGRPVKPVEDRTRGLPTDVEKMIVTALVMPIDGPGIAPLVPTPRAEMETSPWWGWDNATRSERCETIVPGISEGCPLEKKALRALPQNHTTAKGMLEQLNLDAGLRPCATPSLTPKFKYECLKFPATSPYYNASRLLRANFDAMPITEQFAQVRAANLFIFEEGAPLTWALAAKEGSTFICIYGSNRMRFEGDKGNGRLRTLRKEVIVGNKTEVIETLEPAQRIGSFRPATDYFMAMPHLVGKVRLILLVYQYGRWPSMAKLREVYDLPFKPETYAVTCECDNTRVVPWSVVKSNSTANRDTKCS